jgi:hypothetical protein
MQAMNDNRLRERTKIKAMDTRNFPKIVTMAIRTGNWRVPDKQPVPKGQRLILQVNQDLVTAIKENSYKIIRELTE